MGDEKEKYKDLVERSYRRRDGDIVRIMKDTNLPLGIVLRETKRLAKKDIYESHSMVVSDLMCKVVGAHETRQQRYNDIYHYLDERTGTFFSICCDKPVDQHDDSQHGTIMLCSKCGKHSQVYYMNPKETIDLKMRILLAQRKDIDSLIDNAAKLGYSDKVEPTRLMVDKMMVVKQNYSGKPPKQGTAQRDDGEVIDININDEVQGDIESLSPMDRERIIKKLEKHIMADIRASEDDDGKEPEKK